MKLVRLDDLFDVRYGSNLELNALNYLRVASISFQGRQRIMGFLQGLRL